MKKQCPVVKNELYDLDIVSIGSNGEGVGRIDGFAIFVRGALPGDRIKTRIIKAKKNFGIGIIVRILKNSKDRVEPICPVAKQCGGCSLQHLSYEAQLAYKENLICESLVRLGGLDDEYVRSRSESIIGAEEPYYYRNKVQFPVREEKGELVIGFYAKGSHRVIETKRCYIQDTYNEVIVATIKEFMIKNRIKAYNEVAHKGLVRHIVVRKSESFDKFQVTLVINGNKVPGMEVLTKELMDLDKVESVSININKEQDNVILGSQLTTLEGPKYLVDNIKDISYHISPLSFYQVNPKQTVKLYDKALEYADLTGEEIVYDLYCGIGTISLFLAKAAKEVFGVEIVGAAIDDAKQNAKLNNITNAHFYTGKAEEMMPKLYKEEGIKADVVVLDPPRKGCEESLLKAIVEMGPQKIVYVSCDPGTLSRDIKFLVANGFKLEKVCGVDMFSHSTHVESCSLLVKE